MTRLLLFRLIVTNMILAFTIIAAFVIQPNTAISWIPNIDHLFKMELHTIHSSLPMVNTIATWKRLLPPTSRMNVVATEEQHTVSPNGINATSTESVSMPTKTSSLSWMDRTMTRVVSIITYFAIGQSLVHLLQANRSEIANEVRRLFNTVNRPLGRQNISVSFFLSLSLTHIFIND